MSKMSRGRIPKALALTVILAASLTMIVASVYASDCPPDDPSRADCANAAPSPIVPVAAAAAGAIMAARRRPQKTTKEPPPPPGKTPRELREDVAPPQPKEPPFLFPGSERRSRDMDDWEKTGRSRPPLWGYQKPAREMDWMQKIFWWGEQVPVFGIGDFFTFERASVELITGKGYYPKDYDGRGLPAEISRAERFEEAIGAAGKLALGTLRGEVAESLVKEAYMTKYVRLEKYDLAAPSDTFLSAFSRAKAYTAYYYNSWSDAVKGNILKWGEKLLP